MTPLLHQNEESLSIFIEPTSPDGVSQAGDGLHSLSGFLELPVRHSDREEPLEQGLLLC